MATNSRFCWFYEPGNRLSLLNIKNTSLLVDKFTSFPLVLNITTSATQEANTTGNLQMTSSVTGEKCIILQDIFSIRVSISFFFFQQIQEQQPAEQCNTFFLNMQKQVYKKQEHLTQHMKQHQHHQYSDFNITSLKVTYHIRTQLSSRFSS